MKHEWVARRAVVAHSVFITNKMSFFTLAAAAAREKMRLEGGGYRRDHLRALAQRVEVDEREVRIMGSKNELLRTLAAANSAESAANGVPSFIPKWRRGRDSNPRYA